MKLVRGESGTNDCIAVRVAIMLLSLHIVLLCLGGLSRSVGQKELNGSVALDGPEGGHGAIRGTGDATTSGM